MKKKTHKKINSFTKLPSDEYKLTINENKVYVEYKTKDYNDWINANKLMDLWCKSNNLKEIGAGTMISTDVRDWEYEIQNIDNKEQDTVKKVYDIIRCRFVDNKTDKIFYINQYGLCETCIEDFWKSYFKDPKTDRYTFINCFTIKENVEISEDDLKNKWMKKLGIK